MRIILSPAKQIKINHDDVGTLTTPVLLAQSQILLDYLKSLEYNELKTIWKCSDKLADPAFDNIRNADFSKAISPAILSYDGIAFKYMAPVIFDYNQFNYVQENLRILSGLYGILRPMDGIIPYRLEMQSKISLGKYKTLYEFWGDSLYNELQKDNDDGIIINLASKEYSDCITPYLKKTDTMIECIFADIENNKLVQKGVYCKMARGSMVRFMAENGTKNPEDLKYFQEINYCYVNELSDDTHYVFVRKTIVSHN